jgi:hypothetical protein
MICVLIIFKIIKTHQSIIKNGTNLARMEIDGNRKNAKKIPKKSRKRNEV